MRRVHFIDLRIAFSVVVLLVGTVTMAAGAEVEPFVVSADADGVQRATITMDSYSYTPNHLVVQAGKPVELTLTSVTTLTPHNFLLNDPAAGFKLEQDVRAGKSVTVRFTPPQAGTFTFYCDKKLLFFASHREKGMEGRLEVR
ncbi:MAG: cupredoxin domain-containing protein [Nitrospirae bacterium]|nr:cupredoxin domain-containing protein [Nitrospirota bacterium]